MRQRCYGLLLCLLVGCAHWSGSFYAPVPHKLSGAAADAVYWFRVMDLNADTHSLLAVQELDDGAEASWRWVQTDAFGAPLARQRVDAQGWRNDGFIPPNMAASRLFSAILLILNGDDHLFLYPQLRYEEKNHQTTWYRIADGQMVWQIMQMGADEWQVNTAAGEHWWIKRLE